MSDKDRPMRLPRRISEPGAVAAVEHPLAAVALRFYQALFLVEADGAQGDVEVARQVGDAEEFGFGHGVFQGKRRL